MKKLYSTLKDFHNWIESIPRSFFLMFVGYKDISSETDKSFQTILCH